VSVPDAGALWGRARVVVTVDIAVRPERVWRALTDPAEVEAWDGVTAVSVPAGYPAPGQHARWASRTGPVRMALHDRVRVVEAPRCFASTIDVGFVHVEETYRLDPQRPGTRLVSDNVVSSRLPGLGWLAAALARRNVAESMTRLASFCEASP
jgi:uncharacterized protein YndB with AHSA1/START domain